MSKRSFPPKTPSTPTASATPARTPRQVEIPRPWQPRFRTPFMLLIMLTMSIMAASGFYLNQALQGGIDSKMMFIMFTLTSPVISVVALSLGYACARFFIRD